MDLPNRRSKYLINPGFQLRFVGYMAIAILLGVFIFYLGEMYYHHQMVKEGLNLGLPSGHVYFELLERQKVFKAKIYLITSLILSLYLLTFGVLIYHRIAGPLHKLRTILDNFTAGEKIQVIKFRRNDFFQELPMALNKFLQHQGLCKDEVEEKKP